MTSPDSDPKVDLEEAVVARLRAEGLVQSSERGRTVLWSWSAVLVLAVSGLLAMTLSTSQPQSNVAAQQAPSNIYVVAMYAGPEYRPLSANDIRVQEHGVWAGSHQTGAAQIIRGGPLKDSIAQFGQAGTSNPKLVGLFTIRARTATDAVKLANSAPHIRHGGSVVVYPTP